MDNQLDNGFCPNCGALLRDGVCPSCGFSDHDEDMSSGSTPDDTADTTTNTTVDSETNHRKLRNYEKYQNTYLNPDYHAQNPNGQDDYVQNDYAQNGAAQTVDTQNDYEQNNYGQNDYDQSNYNQNNYGQSGYDQSNYNQNNYGQSGYDQSNYTQNNYGQNDYDQNNYAQNGYYQSNGTQNQYYQNGTAQGGYYQQNGNGYYVNQTPQKKKRKTGVIVVAIVGGILLLILIVIFIFAVFFTMIAKNSAQTEDSDEYYHSVYDDDYDDYGYDEDEDYDYDYGYDDDDDDRMAFVDDIAWNDNYWAKEPYNYDAEEVGDDYYYGLCNCIDKDVSYSMVHENYEKLDKAQNVCIRINYYQLEGDIPNLDEINETLKFQAIWPGEIYTEWADDFQEEFEEYGAGYVVSVESYVTYNDEKMISVVSDIYYESATTVKKMIAAANVDLETGVVTDNTEVLNLTDDFMNDYKEICEEQNGSVAVFQEFDSDELKELFEDEDALILFYTPCGLEVGINYETDDKYGWVTATLKYYEQYLK
jgi:hypothetical protein